jgi:conflict system STAND superfamily ATPase
VAVTFYPLTGSWPLYALLLIAITALLAIKILSDRAGASRLLDPEALKLDPRSPEQLIGRREDLDKLLNALANPLVFLVSESGCGKSALMRAGVAQGAAFTARFLPIYIDMSVLDWEDGPLRAVREGFATLPADDPARTRLDARSGPKAYAEAFGEYQKRTLRRPLLLLDQFDDFQADPRHRTRFLPPQTRVWRTADAIAKDNAFWRVLRQCLPSDTVSIVVASAPGPSLHLRQSSIIAAIRAKADTPNHRTVTFSAPGYRLLAAFRRLVEYATTYRT